MTLRVAGCITIAAMCIWTPFLSAQTAPPPSAQPDFTKVRTTGESGLKSGLFDPGSAQIVYTSGFQWGFAKPLIGRRTWGWLACGTLNAKNRMGGYVGAAGFWILSDANGTISWGNQLESVTTCDSGQKVDLQPELRDAPVVAVAMVAEGNAKLGIADELAKLADLKTKGVLTQAEFDAQKAKLLGH